MKKFSKRAVSLASVAVILASIVAMPVSAAGINAYSVSYETLTTAITTEDGNTVPAGAVAVTMSIENNTGFNANTLTLDIDEGYHVVTDANGKPVLEKGTVLAGAMTSAAVSADDSTVCVTAASGSTMSADGGIFTVYFTTEAAETEGFASVGSMDANIATGEINIVSTSAIDYYYAGDTNSEEATTVNNRIIPPVDAVDAANIMVACSEYRSDFDVVAMNWSVLYYFNEAKHYAAPDANCDKVIDNVDAAEILDYAADVGAGNIENYNGKIGMRVPFIPPATSNLK